MVLVTGARMGIGRATALRYAEEGCKVVFSDLNEESGNGTVDEIRNKGAEAVFIKADVSDPAQREALVRNLRDSWSDTAWTQVAFISSLFGLAVAV